MRHLSLAWLAIAACAGPAEPVASTTTPAEAETGAGSGPEATASEGSASPACAAGEDACAVDCAGTTRCMATHACPTLDCAVCPAGTCRRQADGPCATPTGPLGNMCCACGDDGMCSSLCRCAALDTPIATPDGERPISELRVGDLVVSVDRGRRTIVPIARVGRARAERHHVVRVELASGATLRMSPGHPLPDGRTFADLGAGDRLDGIEIVSAELEAYEMDETADILPASDTGSYVAAGVLVGSTLFSATPGPLPCEVRP